MQVGALLQGRERGVATTYSGSDDLLLLPVDIGNLLNLVELKVEQNQLTSVPASIYGCGKLKVLWLSDNNIVSMEPLVALTQLEVLKLVANQIEEVPKNIEYMTQLRELHLAWNRLKTLPREIGNVTTLEKLFLSSNRIVRLQIEVGLLTKLVACPRRSALRVRRSTVPM